MFIRPNLFILRLQFLCINIRPLEALQFYLDWLFLAQYLQQRPLEVFSCKGYTWCQNPGGKVCFFSPILFIFVFSIARHDPAQTVSFHPTFCNKSLLERLKRFAVKVIDQLPKRNSKCFTADTTVRLPERTLNSAVWFPKRGSKLRPSLASSNSPRVPPSASPSDESPSASPRTTLSADPTNSSLPTKVTSLGTLETGLLLY